MKRFYLAGHTNFGNRGNEALARSTLSLLKQEFGDVELLVPSYKPEIDGRQWPTAEQDGVRFVGVPGFPSNLKWWNRARKIAPQIANRWLPGYTVPPSIAKDVESCDGLIASGGDVLSLDYGAAPLLWNVGFLDYFMSRGMPTIVWAASLGPFKASPELETFAAEFLRRAPSVTVRETITEAYMHTLGVKTNLQLVADPAFVLQSESFDLAPYLPSDAPNGLLGLNFSPLIQKFRPEGEPHSVLQGEIAKFIRHVVRDQGMSVLLIPHVGPLGDTFESDNDDSSYLAGVLDQLKDLGDKVTQLPRNLNACQLKHAVAACRFFIGARTHSTIAAFSKKVPTLCIAYSVKAKGLCRDLFGNEDRVLETPKVSFETLRDGFASLRDSESSIRTLLDERIPVWRTRAEKTAAIFNGIVRNSAAPHKRIA